MKIIDIKVMTGPNYWSTYRKQLIVMKLDLEDAEELPTNKIEGFAERMEHMIPSLYDHRCSEKRPGGFLDRVRRGTWLGHVLEHIALEIQSLAGMPCGFGRTRSTGQKGVYHVAFTYTIERAGVYAAKAAFAITNALKTNQPYDINKDIRELMRINCEEGIGPSTQSIINAARKRNIPFRRLDNNSLIMFGQGINQKIISATVAETTSNIGVDLAKDKEATRKLLKRSYIPVPDGKTVSDKYELKEAIESLGFPLAIKPVNSNHGKGVSVNIRNIEEAVTAFERAHYISNDVIVERFIDGYDFRFLVINYKLEAVARRTAAMVTGDGRSTIMELIEKTNGNANRGEGHEKNLTRIKMDDQTHSILRKKNLTTDSVLPYGEILFLKDTANLSTGGTARDVTDMVHPSNAFLAERIARLMNLDICGIDIIAQDITSPINDKNGAVLEVNAGPGFRMHLSPARGIPRNVGEPVINMLYPEGTSARIPVVAVTGTNGKTTTTRLVAHFAKTAGHNVGYTTTDGIYIQDQLIHEGDCSGPASAETILRDPIVDFAVLECARGGILRAGLGFDKCNISIITNIGDDHLGLEDIHTSEQLLKVKSVVARSTFDDGYAILNADDDLVYKLKSDLDCNVALFSLDENNQRIKSHCDDGGWAAIIEKGYFTICHGEWRIRIAKVMEVPLTFEGAATCMISNILPSILAASISGFDTRLIRKGLQTFIPGPEFTPGRMNIFRFPDFRVMIDYAHNRAGFMHLNEFLKHTNASVNIGIIACPGDRRDEDIRNVGAFAAMMFDEIIIRHDDNGRGRTNEELTNLLTEGIRSVRDDVQPLIISKEIEALEYAMNNAKKDALITVCSDKITSTIEFVRNRMKEIKEFADIEVSEN